MAYALYDWANTRTLPHAYEGFDTDLNAWVIPRGGNAHVHFRDPDHQDEVAIFNYVIPISAFFYAWVTAMPNLGKNRIRTVEQALRYQRRILRIGRRISRHFNVVVPFHVEEGLDLEDLEDGFKRKIFIAGKMYSKGATHNSAFGVDFRQIANILPLIKLMEQYDIILLSHTEMLQHENGLLIPDRLREELALDTIQWILEQCPKLRIVFEHVSSKAAIERITQWQAQGYRIEATVAPQYLVWNSTKLFEGGMNPAMYSIPVLKDEEDRLALIDFIVHGGGMLGTDSAPHNLWKKSQPFGCPGGVFNEPMSLFIYFHTFRYYGGEGWFERFKEFACYKAARFYGLEVVATNDNLIIREENTVIPEGYSPLNVDHATTLIGMMGGLVNPYSAKPA